MGQSYSTIDGVDKACEGVSNSHELPKDPDESKQHNVLLENVKKPSEDPRSPTGQFRRTPIRFFPKYGSVQSSEAAGGGGGENVSSFKSKATDPRSPNKEINRTPLRYELGRYVRMREREVVTKLFEEDETVKERRPLSPKN